MLKQGACENMGQVKVQAMAIEWNDKLSVGNEFIDDDHKHLIKLINAYEMAISTGNLKLLGPAFEALERYANEHFQREENLMEAVFFPGLREHRDKHKLLLKGVQEKHKEVQKGGDIDLAVLSAFLRSWLIDHVVKEDMQYKPHVIGKRTDRLTPLGP